MSGPRPKRLEGPSGPFRVFGLVSDEKRPTWRFGDAGWSSPPVDLHRKLAQQDASGLPRAAYIGDAGWSSPVARQAHNLKVVGSNPTPATTKVVKNQKLNEKPRSKDWGFCSFRSSRKVIHCQNL